MNATNMAAAAVETCTFDASRLSSMIKARNTRFELDLSRHSLVGVLEAHEMFKNRITLPGAKRYTNQSIRASFLELQDIIGEAIMPIDVTDVFWQEYVAYMLQKRKPSTVQNYIQTTLSALRWGAKHGARLTETFADYHCSDYEKTKVVLTPSQISHIYHYKIDKAAVRRVLEDIGINRFSWANLERVRDQFVLDCNLGQRYSDAKRVCRDNFDQTGTIYKVVQQKTGGKATVYLPKYAIDTHTAFEILKRYDYNAPSGRVEINAFNKYLHVLLCAIGEEFNELVVTENRINGVIVKESVPMWKAITSHTARRTFASYWLTHGTSIAHIQKCTGHKDLRSLQHYTILDDTE